MTDQLWPSCPTLEQLEPVAAGDRVDRRIEEHIETCPDCRKAVERLRADNEFLGRFVGKRVRAPSEVRGAAAADTPLLESSGTDADTPRLKSSDPLQGYEILSEICRGGQGVIYKAVHTATKRQVALKMLLGGMSASSRQRRRFEREIELVAGLNHSYIVTLYDSGVTAAGELFFAMEYVRGVPLDRYLRQLSEGSTAGARRKPIDDSLRLFAKICEAVQYAHQRGIIHRDLKPDNILIDPAGDPHLLDFGLARALGQDLSGSGWAATQTGEFMGTFFYAAPEQVRGNPEHVDTRTDVYSLGVILYEMLTGAYPYPVSGSLSDVIHSIGQVEPRPPSSYLHQIGDEVETIILTCLRKEREQRYQTAGELLRDIRRYEAGQPIDAKRDSTWYVLTKTMRRHKGALAIVATFAVLLTGFAISMAIQARRIAAQRDAAQIANRGLTIKSGRMAGLAGDTALAEELLWQAHLSSVPQQQPEDRLPLMAGAGGSLDSYWALWDLFASQPSLGTWVAHKGPAWSVSFSPDGKLLASSGEDGTIKLWEVPGVSLRRAIDCGGEAPKSVCFNSDGKLLAWGNADGTIGFWNVAENRFEARLDGHTGPVTSATFSPDGGLLASGGLDRTVRLWNVKTGTQMTIGEHKWRVDDVAFGGTGNALVSIDSYANVKFWDVPTGSCRETLPGVAMYGADYQFPVLRASVDLAPDAARLAIAAENEVFVWDIPTKTLRPLYSPKDAAFSVEFSPDGRWLASGSYDGAIILWNVQRERVEHTYTGHGAGVYGIAFSPDGQTIASYAVDGTIKLWEVPPNQHLRRQTEHAGTVHCVQYSRDGRQLASSGEDGVRVWDTSSGKLIHKLAGHSGVVAAVAFHPAGHQLASVSHDKTIKIWDLQTGTCIRSVEAHDDPVNMVAYSPDGRYVATGCGGAIENTVKLWDAATGDHLHTFDEHRARVPCVCFSPNGKWLASCSTSSRQGNVYIHEIASRASRALLGQSEGGDFRALCFSPDNRILAVGHNDAMISLWDVSTGDRLKAWEAHAASIFSLNFHPEGRILASSGRGNEIKLWDTAAASDQNLVTLVGHEDMVFSVCFHPDGRTLASGSADKTVGLWDLTYYQRHIAGNLEYQFSRLHVDRQDSATIQRLRAWADQHFEDR